MVSQAAQRKATLDRHIVLLGLRASGKSTIGAMVAERIGAPLIDLDDRTLAALRRAHRPIAGATVAAAWGALGEPAFREAEARALDEALREAPAVIALGGGTPTAPGAESMLQAARDSGRAVLLYLRADASTLRARMAGDAASRGGADSARPSLTGRGALEEIEDVLAQRDPIYTSLAQHVIDAGGSRESCAREIVGIVRRPGG